MIVKNLFVSLILFSSFSLQAQRIAGIVTDAETMTPIPAASVYINKSTLGTTTNDQGRFIFYGANVAKFDLIISAVGYVTVIMPMTSETVAPDITIKLDKNIRDIDPVVIRNYEKNGWEKYGEFFLQNFIGTGSNANKCKIKNTSAIKFYFDKKTNILSVRTNEPLIIINNYLGYDLKYNLESWVFNHNTRRLIYTGYPFFMEMAGHDKQMKRWQGNREEAYSGSLMHFFRSIYRNIVVEQGFVVKKALKTENKEKKRVKNLLAAMKIMPGDIYSLELTDSMIYYERVMQQADAINNISNDTLTTDQFAFAIDSITAVLKYQPHLYVQYENDENNSSAGHHKSSWSILTIEENDFVPFFSDGSYDHPEKLLQEGKWAITGKILYLLPVGYEPPK